MHKTNMIKTETIITCAVVEYGFMVLNQTNQGSSSHADPSTVLLDNDSMVHHQININGNGNDHLIRQLPTVFHGS